MTNNHYILKKGNIKHAAYNGEKETLCGLPIAGGERGRDILWFQQVGCPECRKSYALSPRRCDGCSDADPEEIKFVKVDKERNLVGSNGNQSNQRVPVPRYLVEEDERTILSENSLYDEVFTMEVERRMRTIIFVQALFESKGINLTDEEAARKLRNPEFLADMIFLMTAFQNETIDSINSVDASPEAIERAKAIFTNRKNEV